MTTLTTSSASELLRLDRLLTDGRPKSKLETLCIERQIDDLRHGGERGLIWKSEVADSVEHFFGLLRHFEGPKAGKPLTLEPWQSLLWIRPLFGWHKADGTRRFRIGYTEIPRKNGKSLIGSGLSLQGLFDEAGAQVYSAATSRAQAGVVFEGSKKALSPVLEKRLTIRQHAITYGNSFFKPLASDNTSNHGWNIHRAIVDELHEHPNREVWDVLLTGRGARINPLILGITTAGWDRASICYELRETSERILNGERNDSFFTYVATCDSDDWTDPRSWLQANPNLGVSVFEASLEEECQLAMASPDAANTFRRLHLNQWTESAVGFLPMPSYDACDSYEDKAEREARLAGRPCFAGLDLGIARDLSAFVLAFPNEDGSVELLTYCWAPRESNSVRAEQDRRQLMQWANRGFVKLNDGNITDLRGVLNDILALAQRFNIQGLCFDQSLAAKFYQDLIASGFPDTKIRAAGRSYSFCSEPTLKLLELVNTGKLRHGGDPCLRWQMSNLSVKRGDNGDVMHSKKKSGNKIDAAVSTIYALAMANQPVKTSAYTLPQDQRVVLI